MKNIILFLLISILIIKCEDEELKIYKYIPIYEYNCEYGVTVINKKNCTSVDTGYSITQNLNIQTNKKNTIYAFISYFNTDDNNSSVYLSERTIPGSYSSSNFYGNGIRLSTIIKQHLTSIVIVNFKVGFTKYFNKNAISTGLRMIEHSYQTDMDLSIKCKF